MNRHQTSPEETIKLSGACLVCGKKYLSLRSHYRLSHRRKLRQEFNVLAKKTFAVKDPVYGKENGILQETWWNWIWALLEGNSHS